MQLYHGSIEIVKQPILLEKQRLLDFGKGFYTTTNLDQAKRWSLIKKNRQKNKHQAYVSVYELNESILKRTTLTIKEFIEANEQWLDFVMRNRNENLSHSYDMVIGPVANDTLYQTLGLYESGILTKEETIKRLKVHPLYNQIAFNTTEAIHLLQFKDAIEVSDL